MLHARTGSKVILVSLALLTLSGCASYFREPEAWKSPDKKQRVFGLATRQLPPEPVYNPLRWVRPPQVTPTRRTEVSSAPVVMPVVNFRVANAPLKDAILVFAGTAGYRSYCSSMVADRRLTIDALGTLEELAVMIESKAGITVVVDHHNREVRFLAGVVITPEISEAPSGA